MVHVQLQSDSGGEESDPELSVSRRAIRRRREVQDSSGLAEASTDSLHERVEPTAPDREENGNDSNSDDDRSESEFSFEDDSEDEDRHGSAIANDRDINLLSDEEEDDDEGDENDEEDEDDADAIREFNEERCLMRIKRMTRLLNEITHSNVEEHQLFTTDEIEKHNLHSFLCPISHQCFVNPVVAPDGHTYERDSIVEWLRENNNSPMTNKPMTMQTLYHNHTLHASMQTTRAVLNALVSGQAG